MIDYAKPTKTYVVDRVRKIVAVLPVTTEAIEDAVGMRAYIDEAMRTMELATRGFLGLVRCDRCHRRTRCVEWMRVRGHDELLGTSCFRKRWAELVDEGEADVEV